MILETEILQILFNHQGANRAGITKHLKNAPSDSTVKRMLAKLVEDGLIDVTGNGPSTRYKLSGKALTTRIFENNTNYMKKNIALITGVTGQDGSYLSEFLLEKGYEVHGIIRRSSVDFRERIAHLEGKPGFHLHFGDLGDSMSLVKVVAKVKPTEIYNLAAQSHVQVSFDSPEFTADVDATGVLRVLEAVRACGLEKTCRIYQASTSELYGKVEEVPQNENTPFHPYSPYAVAKLYGFWIVKEYREAYDMFCCSGILFNHESERRGETFVTRKITLAAARIAQGKQDKLYLGNLD